MTYPGLYPFLSLRTERAERLVERLVKRRRLPGEETEASLCVGGPSNFNLPKHQPSTPTVNWPDGEEPEEPEEDENVRIHTETWRETTTVRVSNIDGVHYADVQRIDKIRFRSPEGIENEFHLDWPA